MATQVNINNLANWISQQGLNTPETAYEIEVTGLTVADFQPQSQTTPKINSLSYQLQRVTGIYVDLRATIIPLVDQTYGSSDLEYLLYELPNIVYPPSFSSDSTWTGSMAYAFYKCNHMKECSYIPSGTTSMERTFWHCDNLVKAPITPPNVTNMNHCYDYSSLDYKPVDQGTGFAFSSVTTKNWKGTQSQIESKMASIASTCELQIYNDDRLTYIKSVYNVEITELSSWLSDSDANTASTPYEVHISSLTSSNASDIQTALVANPTKYVDLSYTTIPNGTDCDSLFYECTSLVVSAILPTDATSLVSTYEYCSSLLVAPTIPDSVTDMSRTFGGSGITTAPVLPNGVTKLNQTFAICYNLTTAPVIPSTVTSMKWTFAGCWRITTAPIIPEGVTAIDDCFGSNSGMWFTGITSVPYIPSTITSAKNAFDGCRNLTKIDEFKIPLNTLKNNTNFKDMFKDCTSLTSIGYNYNAEDWHLFSLKIGQSDISGKIYSRDKTSKTIASTSITKSTIKLPALTDELWFPDSNTSDQDVEDMIDDLLTNKYGYYNGTTIDPSGNQFVMYADDPSKVISNFPADVSHASGVLPVANGGTNATTESGACTNLIGALTVATGDVTDDTDVITANANGYAEQSDKTIYKRKGIRFWNYIKSKIQNVGSLVIGIASTVGTKLKLKGMTYGTNTYADDNPKVVFENTDASQNISLTFTDYDAVQSPASLTLNGNQGGEYFIAPNVKATSSVYVGSEVVNSANNNSSWWINSTPRGKFKGTNGGSTSGWSPLLAGKTVNGKYEFGSLNNTIYLNYYKDSRTTNGVDKTIFDYTVDGTPNWNGNASTASNLSNAGKQAIFDIVHPVGEIYVQYPGSKTPEDLYNVSGVITSSWQEQSYSGAFFRASGGNASAFITGTTYTQQAGQNGYHRHSISHTHALTGTQDGIAATAAASSTVTTSNSIVYQRGDWSIGLGSATKIKTGGTISVSTTLSGNTSGASTGYSGYDGSSSVTENRPPNLTIRIWKRTA